MVIRKISFIEAGASVVQMLSKFTMARVGTVLLSTLLKERGYEVKVFIEDITEPDWSYIEDSDIVCISTLTSTTVRAYEIAVNLRAQGIPIIMGGVHPTFLPEEALLYSDYVVRGEGEKTLIELLHSLEKGKPLIKDIEGLSYRENDGAFVHNPSRPYLDEPELDNLPVPDFSLVHKWKPSIIYPVSTSRGCPFDCKFCSIVPMFGKKYRFKSIEAVLRELRKVNSVSRAIRFFVDDNFAANKNRTKELLKAMITEGLTSSWSTQVRADIAKDTELLSLMSQAGGDTLFIGFESINAKTLESFNKKQNVEDITTCIKAVKDHGLRIHGMFVLGADTDNIDVIKRTVAFAIESGIDTTQIVALTPLPGTSTFEEMKASGRLLHTDWSKYNLQYVVFQPAQMTPSSLQMEVLKGMNKFYSWRYILQHMARLDLHGVATGVYGKKIVHTVLKEVGPYIEDFSKMGNPAFLC